MGEHDDKMREGVVRKAECDRKLVEGGLGRVEDGAFPVDAVMSCSSPRF